MVYTQIWQGENSPKTSKLLLMLLVSARWWALMEASVFVFSLPAKNTMLMGDLTL